MDLRPTPLRVEMMQMIADGRVTSSRDGGGRENLRLDGANPNPSIDGRVQELRTRRYVRRAHIDINNPRYGVHETVALTVAGAEWLRQYGSMFS